MPPRWSALIVRWCHWLVLVVPGVSPAAALLGYLYGGLIVAVQAGVIAWALMAASSLWVAWLGQRVRERERDRLDQIAMLQGIAAQAEAQAERARNWPSTYSRQNAAD